MKLIAKIEVENFRSIGNGVLEDVGDFSVLAGMNNSGKSNFLRALNTFFSGETDPGAEINVDFDYFKPALKSKKKRKIAVTVHFDLPENFKFQGRIVHVEDFLKGRSFSIRKEWVREQTYPDIFLDGELVALDDRQKIDQFLSLITFRYITNRVLPLDVIKDQYQSLRDVLVRRAKRTPGKPKIAFDMSSYLKQVASASNMVLENLARDIQAVSSNVEGVRLDMPTSMSEILLPFGYKFREFGYELDESVQGAGIQSLLMYQTLLLIDQDFFQTFGWRQAAIWAVEEPESSTHSSLEVHMARLLSVISKGGEIPRKENKDRLQLISTSHSEVIMKYADKGYLIKKRSQGSVVESCPLNELAKKATKLGVSKWTHPLWFYPHIPVVIVDGKYDRIYLNKTLELLDLQDKCAVFDLELLTEGKKTGGVDDIKNYVVSNIGAIKSRPSNAPVIVLLDWESKSKVRGFRNLFDSDDPFKVEVWPEELANPKLEKKFRGIERFYPTHLIEFAKKAGACIVETQGGQFVPYDKYGDTKKLLSLLVPEYLQIEDVQGIKPFIYELLKT